MPTHIRAGGLGGTTYLRREKDDARIKFAALIVTGFATLVIFRLFVIMIVQHDFYTALAAGSHEVYAQLFPERGEVFIQDSRTKEEYPLAINRDYFLLYVDTREIDSDEVAEQVAKSLAEVFGYNDEKKLEVYLKLNKRDDPYEPLESKVDEEIMNRIKAMNLPGVVFVRKAHRFYPEKSLAAHVIGFLGKTDDGQDIGRYGLEGYWQNELAGSGGFFEGKRSASGSWIPLAGRSVELATDGADILLTIDRTLQYQSCEYLRAASQEYGATSASLIVLEPGTGAIRAMCGIPDFDPNKYNEVESIEIYNNKSIFTPYEPGSVFKPVAMAAALNEGAVTPESTFFDSGIKEGVCDKPIRNADQKNYELQTMTGVLENSINTGMVHVVEQIGKIKFREYVERFGFGVKEGIELDSEVTGTIDSLSENKGDKVDCYAATASFGQGITATPIQLISAYGAIANGGVLMKPYIVAEVRYSDGRIDRVQPKEIRRVIEKRSATLLSGMLASVVDNGQAVLAKVPGYYLAGKTGTAQIPGPGGYSEETNHTFIGFGPVDAPKFVMLIKLEKPRRKFASSTTAPLFAKIADFILQYYQVPPVR